MAAENRDQLFEKALARHLRQSGLSDSSAIPSSACADAEALAAYHERLLPLEELNRWKQHIAGCERCREILARLELTDEIPVALSSEPPSADLAGILVGAPDSRGPSAQAAPSATTVSPQLAAVSSAASSKTIALPSRRPRYWHWIAPAGAIAAGLLIWATWRENRPLSLTALPAKAPAEDVVHNGPPHASPPALGATAQSEEGSRSGTSSKLLAPSKPSANFLDEKKTAGLLENKIAEAKRDAAEARANSDAELSKLARPRSSGAQSPAAGPSNRAFQQQSTLQQNARQQEELQQSDGVIAGIGGAKQESAPAPSDAPLRAAKVTPAVPAPELVAPAPAPPPPAPVASAAAPAPKALERKDAGRLARSGVATESVQPLAAMDYTSATMASAGPHLVLAPGRKVVWKIDENGSVQRSTDAGETWRPQDTGVTATLLVGSAPSEKICWLAGAFGTVILTTDGGAHWSKLTPPVNTSIGAISATDARNATVTPQFSAVRFTTSDGGQTWSIVKP